MNAPFYPQSHPVLKPSLVWPYTPQFQPNLCSHKVSENCVPTVSPFNETGYGFTWLKKIYSDKTWLNERLWAGVVFCFFNFVMLLKWQSSIKIFNQIWQYWKYESRKILSTLVNFGIFKKKTFVVFWQKHSPKKQRICDIICFLLNIFAKWQKIHNTKHITEQKWWCRYGETPVMTNLGEKNSLVPSFSPVFILTFIVILNFGKTGAQYPQFGTLNE